jgi:hypothetical protein
MLSRHDALRVAVARAVEQDYLVPLTSRAARELEAVPSHLRWHSPLMVDCAGDAAKLGERIERAGMLWVGCFDISRENVIIIVNNIARTSYVFQRVQAPRGRPLSIGPLESVLIAEGRRVGPNSVVYAEYRDRLPDDLTQVMLSIR